MNVEYINPFLESINSVFDLMLHTTIERDAPRLGSEKTSTRTHMLTSIIGISGEANGLVALCFPLDTAIELTQRFLGVEVREVNDEVLDALAELANMVAGSAKSKFNLDPPPQLSLPTIVEGTGYEMRHPGVVNWIEVPFTSDAGAFSMNVSFARN